MVLRELGILVLVAAAFASATAAYLAVFHGSVTMKEVGSTSVAGVIGVYLGRWLQRGLARHG